MVIIFSWMLTLCCVAASNQHFGRTTAHLQGGSYFMERIAVWMIGYYLPGHTASYRRKQYIS